MKLKSHACLFRASLAISIAMTSPAISAEKPVLEKTDIFHADTEGYAHYRIPGIIATPRGTLLAYCEARKSLRSDWGTIDIMLRRSTDGGQTWEPQRKIVTLPPGVEKNPVALKQKLANPGDITINNPVAIVDRETGSIHFLYCIEYARCFYMHSDDDGVTFSQPVEITDTFAGFRPEYAWQVLATGPGHGIQLRNGRLIVPVWMSTGTGGHAHRPSAVSVIYSDDHGKTWQRGDIIVAHPEPVNPSETVAVELTDGRVMFNIRHETQPRFRGVSISSDGVTGWSPIRYDEQLPEPVCFGTIERLPAKMNAGTPGILFANPHNPTGRQRRNLMIKLSEDEGRTWPVRRVLEPGTSGYSDLAVGPDGTINCFYERRTATDGNANPPTLCIARFNLAWLKSGGE